MIAFSPDNRRGRQRVCIFTHYTPAWRIGTGVQTSLEPGSYRVTGEQQVDGGRYLTLDGRYRIDARNCIES